MDVKTIVRRLVKIAIALLLLAGLAAATYLRATEEPPELVSIEEIESREGKAVAVVNPTRREVFDYIRTDAELRAARRYVLRSYLSEETEEVLAEVGDRVEPGDLLVRFRRQDIDSEIEGASARLREAEENYRRFQNLLERGVVAEDAVEARRTIMQESRTGLQRARSRQRFTEVRVPSAEVGESGRQQLQVSARMVEPGEFKSPGQELFTLIDMSNLELVLRVPESGIRFLEIGQRVEFRLSGEDQWRQAHIQRISPKTEDAHRFFKVYAAVENHLRNGLWQLRPGMYAEARVVKRTAPAARMVPGGALRIGEAGCCTIFIVQPETADAETNGEGFVGKVQALDVVSGARRQEWVEILSPDIPDDAWLVVNPRFDLAPGDRVWARRIALD